MRRIRHSLEAAICLMTGITGQWALLGHGYYPAAFAALIMFFTLIFSYVLNLQKFFYDIRSLTVLVMTLINTCLAIVLLSCVNDLFRFNYHVYFFLPSIVVAVLLATLIEYIWNRIVSTKQFNQVRGAQLYVPTAEEVIRFSPIMVANRGHLVFDYQVRINLLSNRVFKRTVDIISAGILIAVLSLLMIFLATVIRFTSKGPVIYKQVRVGQGGKLFRVLKFRSMVDDAESKTGPVLATDTDDRVTPVGRVMRAARLDELPQLFNVIKGDMSLVGPRPERPEFVSDFEKEIKCYGLRHVAKPGITGLAQVAGDYTTAPHEKLKYDLWYSYNYSKLLDIQLLLATVIVVLSPAKARGISAAPDTSIVSSSTGIRA